MRRPWELARMRQSGRESQGSPRVYVPIRLPDTSASTFAVLELVGFSSSPSSSPCSLSPSLSPSLQQPAAATGHSQLHLPFSPIQISHALNTFSHTPVSAQIPTESSITEISNPSLQVSPRVESNTHGFDAPAPSSSPPPAQKPTVLHGRVHVVPIQIKENVVHTTSLNFKDVVQQLTGASSIYDKDLMPPTVKLATTPTPCGKAIAKKKLDSLSVTVDASKGFKKMPSKLQERRKAQWNLQRLCTDKRFALSISPLSPSPVTPLASYFKKSCTAITPTDSQSSGHSSGVISPSEASFPESNSSNTPIIVPYTAAGIAEHCASQEEAQALSKLRQYASINETFRGPALLSLFPESSPL